MLNAQQARCRLGSHQRCGSAAAVLPATAASATPARSSPIVELPAPPSFRAVHRAFREGPRRVTAHAAVAESLMSTSLPAERLPGFHVVIAGAGISGLTLALGLLKKGIRVTVLERDLTAIRGEGKLRGPIQVQSNALAALEAIDQDVAEEIMRHGCITGDRINGLCDGESGEWYVKFDTFHPAVDRGLPVTRVISRITLQEVLASAVERYGGPDVIQGGCHVVSYDEIPVPGQQPRVAAVLEDGRRVEGDVLVGTDGIWSKIRRQLLGDAPAHYSDYTCYTGISDYVPADIELVGYRVFLGNGQYFVSSDVGEGKMQWYAFHKEPPGGKDAPGQRKARLLKLFGHWNYNVVDLIKATPEADVLRRDIYDRAPVMQWAQGPVVLLGDSAHAMQPNLGQGGCMAIEDAFELANDLTDAVDKAMATGRPVDAAGSLVHYQRQRVMRVSAIHGMAGMAAFMASTYKAYLGEGLGPLSSLTELHIHHPGRVVGQAILKLTMPAVLAWVLGGNTDYLATRRAPRCLLADRPRAFNEREFDLFMRDDDALAARAGADWLLVAERVVSAATAAVTGRPADAAAPLHPAHVMAMAVTRGPTPTGSASVATAALPQAAETATDTAVAESVQFGLPPFEYKGVYLNLAPVVEREGGGGPRRTTVIGSAPSCHLLAASRGVAPVHARVEQDPEGGPFWLHDAGAPGGTWINGQRLERGAARMLHAGDVLEFGAHPSAEVFRVKLQHPSYRTEEVNGLTYSRVNTGAMMSVA